MNINECYEFIQLIANKEQGGFISPMDFNSAMDAAQMEFFNDRYGQPGDYVQHSNKPRVGWGSTEKVTAELKPFIRYATLKHGDKYPEDFMYAIGYSTMNPWNNVDFLDRAQVNDLNGSFLSPDRDNVICYAGGTNTFACSPKANEDGSLLEVTLVYLGKPSKPLWNYTTDSDGDPIYAANGGVLPSTYNLLYDWTQDVPLRETVNATTGVSSYSNYYETNDDGDNVMYMSKNIHLKDGKFRCNGIPNWNEPDNNNWGDTTIRFMRPRNEDVLGIMEYGKRYTLSFNIGDVGNAPYTSGQVLLYNFCSITFGNKYNRADTIIADPADTTPGSVVPTWGTPHSEPVYHNGELISNLFTAGLNYDTISGVTENPAVNIPADASVIFDQYGSREIYFSTHPSTTHPKPTLGEHTFDFEYNYTGYDHTGDYPEETQRGYLGFHLMYAGSEISDIQLYESNGPSVNLEAPDSTHLEICMRALSYLGVNLSDQQVAGYAEGKQTQTPGV
jgi:hypothetical protein